MVFGRSKTVKYLVAPMVSTVLALGLGAVPARAIDLNSIVAVMEAVKKIYDIWKGIKGGSSSTAQGTKEIIDAINRSQTAILKHADVLASAPAKSCTNHAVIEVADIEKFTPQTVQAWAQDVTGCVTLIDSLHRAVTDKATIDQLGLALDVVGPIALLARIRAGFSNTELQTLLTKSNLNLTVKLLPVCSAVVLDTGGVLVQKSTCRSYNGESGVNLCALPRDPVLCDPTQARLTAGRHTAFKVGYETAILLGSA